MAGEGALAVTVEDSTVTVTGEVDHLNCSELAAALQPVAEQGGAVVVDLRAVTFMDSAGVSSVVAARRTARDHGGTLIVLASDVVHRALTVLALETVLGLADPPPEEE